jgi:hypothetical protein
MSNNPAAMPQPAPIGDGLKVADYVLEDIRDRVNMGFKKYGTNLRTNNGRDPLWDAYQEAIDLVMYLRQALLEKYPPKIEEPEEETKNDHLILNGPLDAGDIGLNDWLNEDFTQ